MLGPAVPETSNEAVDKIPDAEKCWMTDASDETPVPRFLPLVSDTEMESEMETSEPLNAERSSTEIVSESVCDMPSP